MMIIVMMTVTVEIMIVTFKHLAEKKLLVCRFFHKLFSVSMILKMSTSLIQSFSKVLKTFAKYWMLNWRGHTLSQDDRLVEAFLTPWIMAKRYLTCPEHALSGQTTDEVICCCVGNSTNRQWFASGVLVETYLSIYSIFNTVSRWWPDLASIDICLVINVKAKTQMFKILCNASLNEIECSARKRNIWAKCVVETWQLWLSQGSCLNDTGTLGRVADQSDLMIVMMIISSIRVRAWWPTSIKSGQMLFAASQPMLTVNCWWWWGAWWLVKHWWWFWEAPPKMTSFNLGQMTKTCGTTHPPHSFGTRNPLNFIDLVLLLWICQNFSEFLPFIMVKYAIKTVI